MPLLETILAQQAMNGANGAMGIGMGALNDKRQIKQQRRLNDLQVEANETQMQMQNKYAMEMWDKTNYNAQKEQMKKAGLNPALIYGMSGGGGATTGGGGGNLNAPNAPSGGGEIMGMMQMSAMQSQIELNKANANKANADAEKTKGADTANTEQGTEESKSRTALIDVQKKIQEVELKVKDQTAEEAIITIENAMLEQSQRLTEAVRNNSIGQKLYETTIKQAQTDLIQTGLENNLIKANTKLTNRQIYKIAEEVAQGWKRLNIEEQNAITNNINARTGRINAMTGDYVASNNKSMQEWDKMIHNMTDGEKEAMQIVERIVQAITLKNAIKR